MIKNLIINNSMNLIKDLNKYNNEELEMIKYGIEGTYLGITKIVIILLISLALNLFKETILFFMLFNIIRIPGFGLHAKKSIWCWITSTISFIGIPIICKSFTFNYLFYLIAPIICIFFFLLYAPADTKKRPLTNKKKRKIYKIITTLIGIIYFIIITIVSNNYYKNILTFAMILQSILILPITYKIFNLSYNNYLNYK